MPTPPKRKPKLSYRPGQIPRFKGKALEKELEKAVKKQEEKAKKEGEK